MSGWTRRLSDDPGLTVLVELPHLHVSLLRLDEGERTVLSTGPSDETAVVFASGRCAATAGGRFWANAGNPVAAAPWTRFAQPASGGRSGQGGEGPAGARPRRRISAEFRPLTSTSPWPVHQALWLPPATQLELQATENAEVVLFSASLDEEPGTGPGGVRGQVSGRSPEMYGGDPSRSREVGSGTYRRLVTPLLTVGVESVGLQVGETYNPPGGWSTYPPHRHDRRARRYDGNGGDGESQHQEVYLFRFAPAGGFGLARLYEERGHGGAAGNDQALVFRHGDALVIPQGYHTVCGAPGYHLHYLWALAGPRAATPRSHNDPEHAWVEDDV